MNNNNLEQQFTDLWKILRENLETLKKLYFQSNDLSNLIEQLSDPEHVNLRKQLESTRQEIYVSIETLAKQTEKLFQTYDKLLKQVQNAK